MRDNLKKISDLLPSHLKTKLYQKKEEDKILHFLYNCFSEMIKDHIKPIYIDKNSIFCAVDNPIWASEFNNYKKMYLDKVNKYSGKNFSNIVCNFLPSYFKNNNEKIDENLKLSDEEEKNIHEDVENLDVNNEINTIAERLLKTTYIKNKKDSE